MEEQRIFSDNVPYGPTLSEVSNGNNSLVSPSNFIGMVSQANLHRGYVMNQLVPFHHNIQPISSKFRGVVSQSNGLWGAQIYYNYQFVWLGTFITERDAAMAYDSAAIRLRIGETHYRNFPATILTIQEEIFQRQLSTASLLEKIRSHTYMRDFSGFLEAQTFIQLARLQSPNSWARAVRMPNVGHSSRRNDVGLGVTIEEIEDEDDRRNVESVVDENKKGFKLFGVWMEGS